MAVTEVGMEVEKIWGLPSFLSEKWAASLGRERGREGVRRREREGGS